MSKSPSTKSLAVAENGVGDSLPVRPASPSDDNNLYVLSSPNANGQRVSLDSAKKNLGGAAVEEESPLGREIGWFSVMCLNLSQMIGTGVFSTPGSILRGTGSVGLSLIYWVIGALIAWAGLAYYLELGAYFPDRAGAEVVYLEQAFRRPRYFFPATFAASAVLLSFSASNCITFANYVFKAAHYAPKEWESKGLAVAAYTVACSLILFSTKWSGRVSNFLAIVKTVLLVLVAITGLVVLGGKTKIKNPTANFETGFQGTTSDANALATSLTKIIFAYTGWSNAHNVLNEVKGGTKTLRWASPASLAIVFVLYFLANIAYFAAVPLEDIRSGGTLVAALFFENVFGKVAGGTVLPILVASSAFGNLIAVAIGQSRVIREVARQGVLPFSDFFTSTRPLGTPIGPILLKWSLTVLVILALPLGDAFVFVVDLASYPTQLFALLNVAGVWLIRRQRKDAGLGRETYRAWNIALIFSIAVSAFLLVMPWVPPKGGIYAGDVSFFYATYCLAGLGILAACFGYWWVWFQLLPRVKGFTWREEITILERGEVSKKFVRDYHSAPSEDLRRKTGGDKKKEEEK